MTSPDSRYYGLDTTPFDRYDYDAQNHPSKTENNDELKIDSITSVYRIVKTKNFPSSVRRQRRANVTDTMSLFAHTYLKDAKKFWVMAELNPHIRHPFDITVNDVINLPPG